jgi:hypothetical protein
MASRRLTIEHDLQALCRKHDLSKSELVIILKGSEPTVSKQDYINKLSESSTLDLEEFEQLINVLLRSASHWNGYYRVLLTAATKAVSDELEYWEDYEY